MKKITLIVAMLFVVQLAKSQNTCATALPITVAGLHVVSAVNGTQIPAPLCTEGSSVTATASEWYAYTPTDEYTVTVTTNIPQNTPKVDTRFHVYTGNCGALTCFAGDDDSGAGYSSVSTFNVVAGTTYYIAFDNRWTSNGFTFQLIENPLFFPPPTPVSYTNTTISTINSTYNMCIVDMNGDHKDDIVGVSGNILKIHYQQPDGTFTIGTFPISGTSHMPSWSLAAGDYNKDGYNDLMLGAGSGLSFWKSNSTGTAYTSITPGEYIFCQRTNFVDINNDGNLDAFSCHDVDPNVYYLNNGSGNMTYYQSGITAGAYMLGITPSGGNYASLWTDYDNDGDSDLFISKCSGPACELHRNDGNGVFTDISATAQINVTPVQSWSSALADFDNDGDMDILIGANGNVKSKLFRNNLDVTNSVEEPFTDISAGSGWDVNTSINRDYVAYDFDNDGLIDVLSGGNKIMFNMGNNTFAPISYPTLSVGAVGDLNSDGFLDILNGSKVRYGIPNENNWVTIALNGVASNSNGIGARIEILGAWGKQIRDIRSGEGFGYMSTLNAHFGIGTATEIDQIIIKWPSGTVDIINNPAPNQALLVEEGSTALGVSGNNIATFTIFPNPSNDFINFNFDTQQTQITNAVVYDLAGKILFQISDIHDHKIDIRSLSTGTYVLLLEDIDGKIFTQKFVRK